ncbi:MAG: tellurite resistance TerB family protein [Hyphomonadaceae bacterium]
MVDKSRVLDKMFKGGSPGWESGSSKGGYQAPVPGRTRATQGDFGAKGSGGDTFEKGAGFKKKKGADDAYQSDLSPEEEARIIAQKEAAARGAGQRGGQAQTTGLPGGLGGIFGRNGQARPNSPGLGGRFGTAAATVGGLAAIGGLAYAAWRAYQNRRSQQAPPSPPAETQTSTPVTPAPADSGFTPPASDAAARDSLGALLVRAMIYAAKADGQIDADETKRIFEEMAAHDVTQEEKAYLLEEIGRPANVDDLARQAQTPQIASQVYAASVMVIGAQGPEETAYLRTLAQKLNLDAGLVAEIHAQVERSAAPA